MSNEISKKQLRALGASIYLDKNGRLKLGRKKGVSRKQVKKDPAFVRTRKLAAEFGRAGRMSGQLKRTFDPWSLAIGGPHLGARLVRALMEVIRTDTRNALGNRCVADGDLQRLEGFEYNESRRLPLKELRCRLLRQTEGDRVLIKMDAFSTSLLLDCLVNKATHLQVILLVAALPDASTRNGQVFKADAGSLLIGEPMVPSLQVAVDIVPVQTPVIYCAALAVKYYRFAGSESQPFDQGKQDLLQLVKVFSA